jgi:hypothetical protein
MRNISKLIDSGFDSERDENKGYYIPKSKEILTSKDMQLIRESIDLNCRISPEEKNRIIQLLIIDLGLRININQLLLVENVIV